jgi:lysozyme
MDQNILAVSHWGQIARRVRALYLGGTTMIHEDAIDLIQFYEGCDNVAVACPAHVSNGGTWPYLTIGYGHSGADVKAGMHITTSQARDILARDLANVETMGRNLVRVPLNEAQMGAVCALAFNVKPGLFTKSQCLARLNHSDFGSFDLASCYQPDLGKLSGMAREWAEFRGVTQAVGGIKTLNGLVKRRASELELFFHGHWSVPRDDKMPSMPASNSKPVTDDKLHPGMRDPVVMDLHGALEAAGFPVTCMDAYTWVTADAVRAFQKANDLLPDGVYGPKTAMRLAEVLNRRSAHANV